MVSCTRIIMFFPANRAGWERTHMGFLGKIREKLHNEDPRQRKRELRWLLEQMKNYRGIIAAVSLLGLVGTLMSLGGSVASKYLIDAVTGHDAQRLRRAAVLMVGMMLLSMVLRALSSWFGASAHVKVKNEMQSMTYGRILRAGWEALEPYRSGDLLSRLNSDVNVVSDGVMGFVTNLLTSLVRFLGALLIILCYDPSMALIALLGVPVTLLLSKSLMGRIRRHNLTMKELGGEVMSFQEDSFRNLTSIKAFSITDRFSDEMRKLQGEYADAYLSFQSFQIGMSSVLSLVSLIVTGGCFGWGVYRLWTGSITYGSLTLFLQLAGTLRSSFSSLVSVAQSLISLMTSAGRLMAVEDLPAEEAALPDGLLEEAALDIRLEQVSFEYLNGDMVLQPFDFRVDSGDLVAITGPSGEGKTTLLRLLLGLVQPRQGSAVLMGQSGSAYPLAAGTRQVFAYVPQGNSVFSGTIAENLRLVRPDASDEELERALDAACALDFVKQFPDGLDHPLGAGGRGISEGQAQRLAIARALLRRAPILLLDEATSALDIGTERRLLENLRKGDWVHTCILVTHRPGSAEFCNRAYEIHHGQVSEVAHGT